MKKLFVFTLMVVFSLTLAACDLAGNDIVDEIPNIESTFTVQDQTVDVDSTEQDWISVVTGLNDTLPSGYTISVVEDNVDYTTPGTYTVTVRVEGPEIDFTRTFDVVVEETTSGSLAQNIVTGYSGDVTYLSTYMDPIMNSDTKETITTIELVVDEYDYYTEMTVTHTLTLVSTTKLDTSGDADVMHQNLVINMDGESITVNMFLEREDDSLTLYVESSLIEYLTEDPTIATDLGITEEYMTIMIPGDFATDEGFDMTTILAGIEGYLETLMLQLGVEEYQMMSTEIDYVVANIGVFAKYLTLEYYMNQEGMTAELTVTGDDEVLANMTMANSTYATILGDIVTDLETFATGLIGPTEVPDIQSQPEYQQVLTILNGLQPMEMDALYDPTNPNQINFSIDLAAIVNTLMAINSESSMVVAPVDTFTINIQVNSGASVSVPTETSSVNAIIPNVAKVAFLAESAYMMSSVVHYNNETMMFTFVVDETVSLSDLSDPSMMGENILFDPTIFDLDLSYVVNRGTDIEPVFYYQLVWADGQDAFVREISISEVLDLTSDTSNFTTAYELVNDNAFDFAIFIEMIN